MIKKFSALLFLMLFSTLAYSDGVWNSVVSTGNAKLGSYTHLKFPSWGQRTHFGVDILANSGTQIHAMAGGIVQDVINSVSDTNFNSLGYMVIIKHPRLGRNNGDLYSIYLHMRDAPKVNKGNLVYAGDVIGLIGATGAANGTPHTHFEIRYFSSRFSNYNNIYAPTDVRLDAYAKSNWENPESFNIGWKWHGNGSIISNSSGIITCWGCDKDEARIHNESEKGFMPEISFQWQGSLRCQNLKLEEVNGEALRAKIFLKPWEIATSSCQSPNCFTGNIVLPYVINNTFAPAIGMYKLVNIQFQIDPIFTKQIIARCQ